MDQQYELRFWDLARCAWCIKFFVPSYTGEVEILQGSGHPLQYDFQNQDDDFSDPYRPTQVKIEIGANQNWKFTDLFDPNIMSCWVEIYQGVEEDSPLFFQGWVDPSQYEEPYDVPPYYLTITVVDGLKYLTDIKYAETENSDGTYEYYEDRMFASLIIYNIFGKIGRTEFNEYINLYAIIMNAGELYSPVSQLLLENDRFYDMSCEEVLIEILSILGKAVLRDKDGVFEIFRPVDFTKDYIYGRHFTNATVFSPIGFNPVQYIHRTATHKESALRQISGGTQLQVNPAKRININQEYGYRDSWLDNYTLNKDSYNESTQQFEGWAGYNYGGQYPIPIGDLVPGEDEGVALYKGAYLTQTFAELAKLAGDDEQFKLEFEYGFYNRFPEVQNGIVGYFCIDQIYNLFFPSGNYLYRSTGSNKLTWTYKTWVAEMFYSKTDEHNELGYGWSGWNTASFIISGMPSPRPLHITLKGPTYNTSIYICFRNVKFTAITTKLSKYSYKRSFWERVRLGLSIGFFRGMASKYTLKGKYTESDTIVENTYNPITNITHGDVLDYNFIFGDVVKISSPENDGDTGITNNLEQFAGALAVQRLETVDEVLTSYITRNQSAFFAVDVELAHETNSAGIAMLLFKAVTSGVDFSTEAAAGTPTGDLEVDVYTLQANQTGTRALKELTIAGNSGSVIISVDGISCTMYYYGSSIAETIQQFVDQAHAEFLPCTLEVGSDDETLLIHGDYYGNSFVLEVDEDGLTATETYSVTPSPINQRIDVIEITGTNGVVTLSCNGVSRSFYFSFTVAEPSSEWGAGDDSSDAFPYKPLLQIIGDELASQYSRVKLLISGMPIIERITEAPSGLNINGCIVDTQNTYDGTPRRFAINRGSFDVRHRLWELDLVEILPYEGVQPEIEPPAESSGEEEPPASSEDLGLSLNHIDTIADGRYGTTMDPSFEYTAVEDRPSTTIRYYFSADAAGELATTIEEAVNINFVTGTHTYVLSGVAYPTYTSKYLHIYLEDDQDERIASNEFDSVAIGLNSIVTIHSPQHTNAPISPDVTFNSTTYGGTLNVTIHWAIRRSSGSIVSFGSEAFTFSTGGANKTFTEDVMCPVSELEDCTLRLSFSYGDTLITSNAFDTDDDAPLWE